MTRESFDVIIVGGGISGLNLATLTYGHDDPEIWDHSGPRWVQEGSIDVGSSLMDIQAEGVDGLAQVALEACQRIVAR